jgi:hypothetical protein
MTDFFMALKKDSLPLMHYFGDCRKSPPFEIAVPARTVYPRESNFQRLIRFCVAAKRHKMRPIRQLSSGFAQKSRINGKRNSEEQN